MNTEDNTRVTMTRRRYHAMSDLSMLLSFDSTRLAVKDDDEFDLYRKRD